MARRNPLRRPNPAAGKAIGTGIAVVVAYPVAVFTFVALAFTGAFGLVKR